MRANEDPRSRYSVAESIRPALRYAYDLWMPHSRWYESVKSVIDLIGGAVLLALTAPLILIGVLLVKLTSRGPAFYTQTRLGRHGKHFTIYKLRSMTHNCERASGVRWATKGDSRVTPMGRFLRASHIDELPQLWNVVKGDMSLVGPRPERPEFLGALESALPFYRCRLLVRPGLTGLAQVQLPPDSDLKSVRLKLAHDLHYVRDHDLRMDLQIMAATLGYLARIPPTWMRTTLQLPGGTHVQQDYEYHAISQTAPEPAPAVVSTPRESPSGFHLQVAGAS